MVFFGAKDRNHSTLLLATKHTKMVFFGAKDRTREYLLSVQFSEEGIMLMHHVICLNLWFPHFKEDRARGTIDSVHWECSSLIRGVWWVPNLSISSSSKSFSCIEFESESMFGHPSSIRALACLLLQQTSDRGLLLWSGNRAWKCNECLSESEVFLHHIYFHIYWCCHLK